YVPVPADYDGDGRFDLAIVQRSKGNWYVLESSANFTTSLSAAGSPYDAPVTSAIATGASDLLRQSDFDGDGRSDMTVYNMSTNVWSSLPSSLGFSGGINRTWGGSGDFLVPGDYDGDGKTDYGLYKASTGVWTVPLSSTNFTTTLTKSAGGPT